MSSNFTWDSTGSDAKSLFAPETCNQLDAIFKPNNVALIGASEREGSVSKTILMNLIVTPFGGGVYPVNPTRAKVCGIKAYKSIKDVPEQCDLAVICIPAKRVLGAVTECGEAGVRGLVIISAGFKEVGKEGAALEQACLEEARKYNMRIIGPNCLGVMVPTTGLNASFASTMALKGEVAFISQSGALMCAMLDWSLKEGLGFSGFVSCGSMVDVDWGDLIYYFGNDPKTKAILIYMESIGNARSFISAAREVALHKPIIVIKPGRTAAAAAAAASHTGSLTGSDDVLTAAFKKAGVVRVDTIEQLFDMAAVLDKQPLAAGPRMTVITNAGGPGVITTDEIVTGGGQLAKISPEAMAEYNSFLPGAWSHNNPVDVLGDAPPAMYAKALKVAGDDKESDGMLVILTPQSVTKPTETAEELAKYAHIEGKPVMASWMGGKDLEKGRAILRDSGIPVFDSPDMAAKIFNYCWAYSSNKEQMYEEPKAPLHAADPSGAKKIIEKALEEGRNLLTENESKQLLASYGIPVVQTVVCETVEKAQEVAEGMKYPVVVKLNSETITHKSDVGGVQLNIKDKEGVATAWNTIRNQPGEAGQAGRLPGCDGAASAEPERRLRADLRKQPGQPGGSRDRVRNRRHSGGGVQGLEHGSASSEHRLGAPLHGEDQDLQGSEGSAWQEALRSGAAGPGVRPLLGADCGPALDQGAGHQPHAGYSHRHHRSGRPCGAPRSGYSCGEAVEALDARISSPVQEHVHDEERCCLRGASYPS